MDTRRHIASLVALVVLAMACKSGDSGSDVSDDTPAGQVTELAGAVSAERAGAKRALSVGDKVFGNDVVSTAEGASVAVRLFHNDAVWRIEGNKTRVLKKTAAWRAPKGGGGGLARGAGTDETAAAGRHGERSAVDTRATARAAVAPTDTAAGTAPPPPPSAPAPRVADTPVAKAAAPTPRRRAAARRPAKMAARTMKKKSSSSRQARIAKQRGKIQATLEALTKKRPGSSGGSLGSTRDITRGVGMGARGAPGGGGTAGLASGGGRVGTIGRGAGSTKGGAAGKVGKKTESAVRPKVTMVSMSADGALSAEVARRVLRRHLGGIRACYQSALRREPKIKGVLGLRIDVAPNGRVTKVVVAGTIRDKTMKDCVSARVRRFRYPAAKDDAVTNIIQRLRFAIP